jgi:hypothetical protein
MGIGHLAASFALRSRFPRVPLYVLLVAGVLVDLFWGVAILAGLEHAHVDPASPSSVPLVLDSAPFTHSLLACVGWGVLVAAAWGLARRDRAGALVLGALVVSHWLLDWVSHVPEMPVLPSGPYVGLGLWRSRGGSLVVEVSMLWIGLALYARATTARDRIGTFGVLAVTLVLTAMGVATFLGPPPPSVTPLAVGNLALALLLLPIEWVDRHRQVEPTHPARHSPL